MNCLWRGRLGVHIPAWSFVFLFAATLCAQQMPDVATIIRGVDSSVQNRLNRLSGYTVTEHYAVFRGHDGKQVADMVVKTMYRKETGKSYTIVSQSGSSFWRSEVLNRLLDNEKRMSQPENEVTALINSSNYEMKLDRNPAQKLDGRQCLLLDITPRRNSEYLFKGTLWVDAKDYAIVQLKGTAGKSAFFLASAAQVTRQYAEISNLPMATHAEAISGSALLGQTVVKIDYSDYQLDFAMAANSLK
jgi:outer membrane lipoprotein-sorting protein